MGTKQYALPPGKNLGRNYHILEFLGHGWEGEVYKVEDKKKCITHAAKLFYKRTNNKDNHIDYAKKLYNLRGCEIVIQYHHQDVVQIKGDPILI